jgi:hypothetical protein
MTIAGLPTCERPTAWLGRQDSNLCISESEFAKTLRSGREYSNVRISIEVVPITTLNHLARVCFQDQPVRREMDTPVGRVKAVKTLRDVTRTAVFAVRDSVENFSRPGSH